MYAQLLYLNIWPSAARRVCLCVEIARLHHIRMAVDVVDCCHSGAIPECLLKICCIFAIVIGMFCRKITIQIFALVDL